jgi:hypothetical protein
VLIKGDGNKVSTQQRMKRDDAEAQMAAAADADLPSLLRAKRGWVADMKTEIQKNKAEVNTQGNNNDVRVRQT